MRKVGGYLRSKGVLPVRSFHSKQTGFAKLAASVANEYIIPEYTPVSDQGQLSSCVANAASDSIELLKGFEDPSKVEQVSRLFLYYNARIYDQSVNKDEGCFIHNALDSMTKLGVCRESVWDYDITKVFTHPSIEAYREANSNTIRDFYQITSNGSDKIKDIELAIRANHPVIFGTTIGEELQQYAGANITFNAPSKGIGDHAMIIVGVKVKNDGTRAFKIRNSWSNGWGDKGHCWFSDSYLAWNHTNDLFVPTRMIDFTL